jgi:hypothetical protein
MSVPGGTSLLPGILRAAQRNDILAQSLHFEFTLELFIPSHLCMMLGPRSVSSPGMKT